MHTTTPALSETLDEMTGALVAIRQGDAAPYADSWSGADDMTLFGAWGPIERGHHDVTETFKWVASRFGPEGSCVQDFSTIHESGGLAVTVGMERGTAVVDGGEPFEMVIRTTHVYRREDGEWRLIHRHADFPPRDQRRP